MYLVTTLSFEDLGTLIRDKRVSVNNSELLIGYDAKTFSDYFTSRLGSKGYVVGISGRINKDTAAVFSRMDSEFIRGNKVIIEANIPGDVLRFKAESIRNVAEALVLGFSEESIFADLDAMQVSNTEDPLSVEVLCAPYISLGDKVRVSWLQHDEINFDVDGITFVKLFKEE